MNELKVIALLGDRTYLLWRLKVFPEFREVFFLCTVLVFLALAHRVKGLELF